MADTTDIEKKSLEAHVELCAERYRALENRIDEIKTDTAELKTTIQKVHDMVHVITNNRNSQIINWGLGIIASLSASLVYVVVHYVIK